MADMWIEVALAIAAALGGSGQGTQPERQPTPRIEWHHSLAVGTPGDGRLEHGVRLPRQGRWWFTWDPIEHRRPDRPWRRWGTDLLIRKTIRVLRRFHRMHPGAQPVGVGDMSLRHGGYFGPEVGGGIGHITHQSGFDVDVYYPRVDRRLQAPTAVDQVDVERSQDLVDLFLAAGAARIYVGPSLPLTGPPGVVVPLVNHDNHLHASFYGG